MRQLSWQERCAKKYFLILNDGSYCSRRYFKGNYYRGIKWVSAKGITEVFYGTSDECRERCYEIFG